MDLSLFAYHLPPELIAQEPAEPRDSSRLLVVDRARASWADRRFGELPDLLEPGDCLVANESKVIPARLLGTREGDGRPVELLMLRPSPLAGQPRAPGGSWLCAVVGVADCLPGHSGDGEERGLRVEISRQTSGERCWIATVCRRSRPTSRATAPMPEDRARYQTVYARHDGSVAAPTAGLHFTAGLIRRLQCIGVEIHFLTLHIGAATFRPLTGERVESHQIDPEAAEIPDDTARAVNQARAEGRRVIAVGTTTTRALEWAAHEGGPIKPGRGAADLYIYPGYAFKAVDGLITNFHLPRSSLLLLASALCGRELLLKAYAHAVAARYRFYSYGDAMLIV
jgi:S-adenosylmethionine:tRNA ribosyltransferase-isomerase